MRNGTTTDVSLVVKPMPTGATRSSSSRGTWRPCDPVAAGTQILLTGGQPTAELPDGDRLVALIGSQDPGTPRVVWVDVAADGTVTTGTGLPDWWTAEALTC